MASEENMAMIKDFLSKKNLLQAAKGLYFIHSSFVSIVNTVKQKKKLFRDSKQIIIDTVEKVKPTLGFERALRAFNITNQQFTFGKKESIARVPELICAGKGILFKFLQMKKMQLENI